VIAIFISSGDLGDVGKHAVAVALQNPAVSSVKLFRKTPTQAEPWKCSCPDDSFHTVTSPRLETIHIEWFDPQLVTTLRHHLVSVTHVLTGLGNRVLFHRDDMSKHGMERVLPALTNQRLVMLSSVGVAEDWPPMTWSAEGRRLESCFRTISWSQHQDLCAGEAILRAYAARHADWEYTIVRVVLMPDSVASTNEWVVQTTKNQEPFPAEGISKLDCARFLVQQLLEPQYLRRAVTVGRKPDDQDVINW